MNKPRSSDQIQHLEERLGERDDQLKLAIEAANLGTWHWSPAIDEVRLSARAQAFLGLEETNSLSLRSLLERVHELDRPKLGAAFAAAISQGATISVNFRVPLASGGSRWLHGMGHAARSGSPAQPPLVSGVLRDVTESTHALEARDKRRSYLQRQLLQASSAGIAKLDRDLRIVSTNERFQQHLRLGEAPLAGRPITAVLPDLPDAWHEGCERCLEGLSILADVGMCQRGAGSAGTLKGHVYAWFNDCDEIGGVVLVTELCAQADDVDATVRMWRTVVDENAHGMAMVESDALKIRAVNPAFARLVNYTPERLIDRTLFSLCPPDEHPLMRRMVAHADALGACIFDMRHFVSDGSVRHVELSLMSIKSAQGVVRHRVATVWTKAMQTSTPLAFRRRSATGLDAELQRLVESSPVGALLLDHDGGIRFANEAWRSMVDVTSTQDSHANWLHFIHAEDRHRVARALAAQAPPIAFNQQFRYQRDGQKPRWVHAIGMPTGAGRGDARGRMIFHVDVTERMQLLPELEKRCANLLTLFHHVDQLRDLERRELAATLQHEMAEDLDRMSVDLNAMARAGNAAADQSQSFQHFAHIADAARDRVRHLILELNPPSIGELGFEGALERFAAEHSKRAGTAIHLRLPPPPLGVAQYVLTGLYEVAREAIANALEHARATSIEVSVDIDNGIAKMRVGDDGIGIAEKHRNKPGCFGLIAAAERISHLGGTLRAFSVPAKGTIVEASVPVNGRGSPAPGTGAPHGCE